jgi:hypothetical protein
MGWQNTCAPRSSQHYNPEYKATSEGQAAAADAKKKREKGVKSKGKSVILADRAAPRSESRVESRSAPVRPSTKSRVSFKNSHATRADEDEDYYEDDEDDYIPCSNYATYAQPTVPVPQPTVPALALTTLVSGESDVYFDNCSETVVVKTEELAIDINGRGPCTRVHGSVPGGLEVRAHGAVAAFGRAPVYADFANLIAEITAVKASYRVVRGSANGDKYVRLSP